MEGGGGLKFRIIWQNPVSILLLFSPYPVISVVLLVVIKNHFLGIHVMTYLTLKKIFLLQIDPMKEAENFFRKGKDKEAFVVQDVNPDTGELFIIIQI